jgi:predicted ester cyclase
MSNRSLSLGLFAASALTLSVSAHAADSVEIRDLVIAKPIPDVQRKADLKAIRAFYNFWNTGDEELLKQAIADNFADHTLPPGRPQGPKGPVFASRNFRAAVPDLKVALEKVVLAGDYVTVHMSFTGHFTGTFGHTHGSNQAIAFIATDLVKITKGRITDNWHIEDNLTLLTEMGIARVNP